MKRLNLFMLCSLIYGLSFSMTLGNFSYNIYDYNIHGSGMAEVSCAGTWISGEIEIPGGVSANGTQFNVIKVAANGFQACTNITSVTLPPTLESIGERGFYLCTSLQSVSFPYGVYDPLTIGKEAFSQCQSLTSIDFPENTVSIGESVLAQCNALTSISIPSTMQNIGKYAFTGCNSLKRVNASSIENWCKLEIANFEASPFSHNELSELVISNETISVLDLPTNVKKTGAYTFAGYKALKKIIFNKNFEEIGEGCFQYASNIEEITSRSLTPPVAGKYCFDGVNKNIPIHVPDVAVEYYRNATGWSEFTNYVPIITETSDRFTVNNIVYSVTDMPFGECKVIGGDVTNLIIPDQVQFDKTYYTVTKIDEGAFENKYIEYVELPASLREIGARAFKNNRMSELTIPSSVEIIGDEAFRECFYIKNVNIHSSVLSSIGESAFVQCVALEKISLPSSLSFLGKNAFNACQNLKHVEIKNGLTRICEYAFMATGIESLVLPESVSTVDANAFLACENLKTVFLQSPEIFISNGVFWSCENLKEVCILADEIIRAEICEPFDREGIKIYVNKTLHDSLIANNIWKDQDIITREIIISEEEFELAVGMTSNIEYEVHDASMISNDLTWTSSDTGVFSYFAQNNEGVQGNYIKGNGVGSASLIVNGAYGLKAERPVNVLPIAERISLYNEKVEINIGETDTISLVVTPIDAYIDPEWSSSDENVLCIYEIIDGGKKVIVRGNDFGQSEITVRSAYTNLQESCVVTVTQVQVKSISLSVDNWSGKVGETFKIEASVLPDNAFDKSIKWSSNDRLVASVDENGNVMALSVGKAIITATCGEVSASCAIEVVATPVEGITLSQDAAQLKIGESIALTAAVEPEDATDKTVIWTSDNAEVASVDENGNVTAMSVGQAVIMASCGEVSASCIVEVVPIPVESISISQESAQLKVGEGISLTATVFPENATDKTVTWTSENAVVASVDENGNVTALALGSANIIASCGEVRASCSIEVVATPVESITLSQDAAQLKVGEYVALSATVLPENATDKTVSWTSDNAEVASVDENGNVTALSIGQAVIMASCGEVSAFCSIEVVATPVESITLSQESAQLKVGESVVLSATILPEDATYKTIMWTSDADWIASVDANGNVVAQSLGTAIISASCGEVSAYCYVTVVETPVESITISSDTAEMYVGESIGLQAYVMPEDATDKTVTWTSDNPMVVSVDQDGIVTAHSVGQAGIIASCGEVSAICHVTVNPVLVEAILLSPDSWSGDEGQSFKIEAAVFPENATDKTLEWSTSDANVAEVDGEGNVTVLHEGTCVITAAATDGSGIYAECIVTGLSGIEAIFAEDSRDVEIYDMNGILIKKGCNKDDLKRLTRGIYIIRSGSTIEKVVIR